MNKQELLESYTMEQLADMVVEKYNREKSEERPYGAHYNLEDGKAIRFIGFEREDAEPFFVLIHERITEKPMSLYPSDKLLREVDEINHLKDQLNRKENAINQIDDILNELFGVTHDVVSKTDEFKKILKEKIENSKTLAHFLPTEPIKVADILISKEGQYERNAIGKAFCGNEKGTYNLFDVSELRQIAEHLLVYCNENGEREE